MLSRTFVRRAMLVILTLLIHQATVLGAVTPDQLKQATLRIGVVQAKGKTASTPVSIVLLPEVHGVFLQQLEEALFLNKLAEAAKLDAIVLEGLLPEDANFRIRPKGISIAEGLTLLREGTLSAAEFMYATQGTELIPGETPDSYHSTGIELSRICPAIGSYAAKTMLRQTNSSDGDNAHRAMITYNSSVKEINSRIEELNKGVSDTCKEIKMDKSIKQDTSSAVIELASHIPSIKDITTEFCDTKSTISANQIEDQLGRLKTLRGILNSELNTEDINKGLAGYEQFLAERNKASEIMVQKLLERTKRNPGQVVVAVIGAAHTNHMSNLLRHAGQSFAVVRLEALDRFDRGEKLRQAPLARRNLVPPDMGAIGEFLADASGDKIFKTWKEIRTLANCDVSKNNMKERTVLNQSWFEMRSNIMYALDSIGRPLISMTDTKLKALPAVGGGGGDGKLPPNFFGHSLGGMDDPHWHNKNFNFLLKGAYIIVAPNGERRIVAPAIITTDNGKSTTMWFVITKRRKEDKDTVGSDAAIDKQLQKAIEEETAANRNGSSEETATEDLVLSVEFKARSFKSENAAAAFASQPQDF